jgi:hypothetical protein
MMRTEMRVRIQSGDFTEMQVPGVSLNVSRQGSCGLPFHCRHGLRGRELIYI